MQWNEVVRDRETAMRLLCAAAAAENSIRSSSGGFSQTPRQIWEKAARVELVRDVRPRVRAFSQQPSLPAPTAANEPAEQNLHRGNRRSRRRCHCGRCHRCIENARWDRIFNEKFLDLDYYAGPRISYQSPLAGL
jgi:hypothetical protein